MLSRKTKNNLPLLSSRIFDELMRTTDVGLSNLDITTGMVLFANGRCIERTENHRKLFGSFKDCATVAKRGLIIT